MYDAGEAASLPELAYQDGVYYLILEYLSQTLDDVLDSGPLEPPHVRVLVNALAAGLDTAHTASPPIIHRDLKPSNILLTDDGPLATVKLADFGIARSEGGDRITSTFGWVGTYRYMPPEQFADSSRVDATSDVYALALVAWECLTKEVPNASRDFRQTLDERLAGTLPQLIVHGQHCPALEAVLRRALAPKAPDRFPSALVFAESFAKAGVSDGLWSDDPRATESGQLPGTVSRQPTPPESVADIGDLGRSKPYTGVYLERRKNFALLWTPTTVGAEDRGWRTHAGSMAELYIKDGPSKLATRVWLSPTEGKLRIRVTPRGPREGSVLMDRLGTMRGEHGGVLGFAVSDDQVEASVPLPTFFQGVIGSTAMANRLAATTLQVLDSIV
jgi:serine/threonine protein kinase